MPGPCSAMYALPGSPDIRGCKVELHHGTDEEADAPVMKGLPNCKGGGAYSDLYHGDYHSPCSFRDTHGPTFARALSLSGEASRRAHVTHHCQICTYHSPLEESGLGRSYPTSRSYHLLPPLSPVRKTCLCLSISQ